MENNSKNWTSHNKRASQHELKTISRSSSLGITPISKKLPKKVVSFEPDDKDEQKDLSPIALERNFLNPPKTSPHPFIHNAIIHRNEFYHPEKTQSSLYNYLNNHMNKEESYELELRKKIGNSFKGRLRALSHSNSYPPNSPKRLMFLLSPNQIQAKEQFDKYSQYEEPDEIECFEQNIQKSPPSTKISSTFSQAILGNKQELSVKAINRKESTQFRAPKYNEKFTITILNVNHNRPLNPSYIVITFGDKVFQTPISKERDGNWNVTFEFDVSYHYQLFGTCQLDLYEYTWIIPDAHKGRAEIRLASLEGFPETFKNYYELYDKKYSLGTISELARRTKSTQNLGAIQVKIKYKFMKPTNRRSFLYSQNNSDNISDISNSDETNNNEFDVDTKDFENDKQLHEALINPSSKDHFKKIEETNNGKDPYAYGRTSLISADSDSVQDRIFNSEEEEEDSMFNFVGSYIISKATRAVLKGITRVYLAFNQGLELKYIEFFNGILLLEKYFIYLSENKAHIEAEKKSLQSLTINFTRVEEANYFYKYALAAYGWRGLVFFSKIAPLTAGQIMSDHEAVKQYLKLNDQQLLGYEFRSNELFQPTYFIALDEFTSSLVISVRGTMSVLDTLTDLVCEYQPWRGGLVHSGVLAVAQSLMRNVIPNVMAHAIQHKVRKIYLVGHSLGGATVSLLTMMLLDHLHEFRLPGPEFELRCYAYGPPPSVSQSLASSTRYLPFIHTFVYENDIVSRLSYGAMMDFKAMILAATEVINEHNGHFLSFERFTSVFQTSEDAKKARDAQLEALDIAWAHQKKVEHINPKLYLPGKIYHLKLFDELIPPFDKLSKPTTSTTLDKNMDKLKSPYMYCLSSVSDDFLSIKVNTSMLLDHLPSAYDYSLNQCKNLIDKLGSFVDVKL